MKRFVGFAPLALSLLCLSAHARTVEKIVAVVGDDIILQSELNERVDIIMPTIAAIKDPAERSARQNSIRREMLDIMVDERLLNQQANEIKLTVTSDQVDRAIAQIKNDYGLTDEQLKNELAKQGMSMATYRQNTRREILKYQVLNAAVGSRVNVGDSEVQNYYDRHMKTASIEVRASHIFIAIPENADHTTVVEKEKFARSLRGRADQGEDFAQLAREFSEDANTRKEGGDLGFFGRDILPKPIEEMVFAMKTGEVKGPVRADRGFHVLKLIDRRTKSAKPLSEVQEEIRAKLRQREMEKQTKLYLDELRKKILVDIRLSS